MSLIALINRTSSRNDVSVIRDDLTYKALIVICNEGAQNGLTSTIDVDY